MGLSQKHFVSILVTDIPWKSLKNITYLATETLKENGKEDTFRQSGNMLILLHQYLYSEHHTEHISSYLIHMPLEMSREKLFIHLGHTKYTGGWLPKPIINHIINQFGKY